MAPTARQLEEALIKAATSLFEADPDNVTVNMVRNNAAESLSIEESFFTSAQWKTKSKDMIKGYVVSKPRVSHTAHSLTPSFSLT